MFKFIALILVISMTPLTAVKAETGRYVRLELPGAGRTLHIAEVKVFSGAANVAQNKAATQISTFGKAIANKAVDGNTAGVYAKGSVSHTTETANVWWQVDLGKDQAIDRIEIYNRTDCCVDRINPGVIRLLDTGKKLKWEAAITQASPAYTFAVPKNNQAMVTSTSSNLLRNAGFTQATNASLPDYWDLHHAAAIRFIDLHQQYGIDPIETPPVAGVKALKIVNTEDNYPYVILMPKQLPERPAAGAYVFSFYAKAAVNNANLEFMPWWPATTLKQTVKLSTDWKRYSFNLSQTQTGTILQPILKMLNKSAYYIAAPQLELGSKASAFSLAKEDNNSKSIFSQVSQLSKQAGLAADDVLIANRINAGVPYGAAPITAAFEYNLYNNEATAIVQLTSRLTAPITVSMNCSNAAQLQIPSSITLTPKLTQSITVSLANLPTGQTVCNVFPVNQSKPLLAKAAFYKLPANPNQVRVNNFKGYYEVDGAPFRIIGMGGIGTWDIPPLWYFQDLKARGFNTVIMTRQPPSTSKGYDYADVDKLLSHANTTGLKVMLGFAAAGVKPKDLSTRMTAFTKLVEKYRDNPAVLGWYALDEPAANSWTDAEVQDIYKRIKSLDPYKPVMINWAYDGLPNILGNQPRGGLYSTDVYSFDYYPFNGTDHRVSKYLDYASRAALTAAAYGLPSHSWLQLYGTNDAWREPTPDELEYMAHVSLIFNQMFSYWDTKSNSKATWDRVATINANAQSISQLILSKNSTQIISPKVKNQFIYSAWKVDGILYLLVANNTDQAASFSFDLTPFKENNQPLVQDFYGLSTPSVNGLIINEIFDPYKIKAYKINL